MFYQLALAKFGNMGLIELSDPPKISDLLVQALEDPNNAWKTSDPPKNHIISVCSSACEIAQETK